MSALLPDPDVRASELIWRAALTDPPVDLRAVVNLFVGLEVSLESLDGPGYFVDLGDRGAEILIRATDPLPRRRFTVAHELGHFILASHEGRRPGAASDQKIIERWCDRFAASLLMPREWLLHDLHVHRTNVLAFVMTAPRRYRVSPSAMRFRVAEIAPLDLFVIAVNGEITIEQTYSFRPSVAGRQAKLEAALGLAPLHRRTEYRLTDGRTEIVMLPLGRHPRRWLVGMFDHRSRNREPARACRVSFSK